jgi:putative ABC transport system permease protein
MNAQAMITAARPPAARGERLQELLYATQECLRSALSSIRAHGLRSFLTMLGVIIGVASVICVIALLQGLSKSITQQFESLGGTALTLRSYTSREDELRGKINRLRPADLDELRFRIEGITNITPMVAAADRYTEVRNGSSAASGQLLGTVASYQDVQQIFPRIGRFLTASDNDSRRRVVVLGEQMRKDLKLPEDPTGRFVQIGAEWFKVVGVMEPRGEFFGQNLDRYLLMPYQTALAVTGVLTQPDLWISFSVNDADAVENVRQRTTSLVRHLHQLKPGQSDDFVVEASDALARSFKQMSLTGTLVVAGVVGISLLVGGVGIMNIMLVSVTERTREIGIAKALGAPRRFILMQFLIEAMVLAVTGGMIGIAMGFAMSYGIAALIPKFPEPAVPWWAIVGSCTFSALIGIAFGILPARKAANLAPIDALRYE